MSQNQDLNNHKKQLSEQIESNHIVSGTQINESDGYRPAKAISTATSEDDHYMSSDNQ